MSTRNSFVNRITKAQVHAQTQAQAKELSVRACFVESPVGTGIKQLLYHAFIMPLACRY